MRTTGKILSVVSLAAFLWPTLSFASSQQILTDTDLMSIALNPYASGELPLGDNHYVLDGPKKGYIYLCHEMRGEEGGSQLNGPWIHGSTWNINSKFAVQGNVAWTNAQFTNQASTTTRDLSGNGLPINHTTGNFPIHSNDPAYYYDRNPNSIAAQNLHDSLPLNPTYLDEPHCMGGEAGVMLTGVPLFNGFDAGMRDAAAHEVQDSCQGHPQKSGQYHYHSLSSCIKDVSEKTVIGYALDGFPITGPMVAEGRYLVTANLDECHGITSEILEDGKKKITYHYVMTQDFPYSVSCFRGTPARTGPSNKQQANRGQQGAIPQNQSQATQPNMQQMPPQQGQTLLQGQQGQMPPIGGRQMGGPPNMQQGGMPQTGSPNGGAPQPPGEAVAACEDHKEASQCGFATRRGDIITGRCLTPPGQSQLACVPVR